MSCYHGEKGNNGNYGLLNKGVFTGGKKKKRSYDDKFMFI